MSTIDTSTWNPDADLNTAIEGIPLNSNASISQTWQALRVLMAAVKGDGDAIKAMIDVMQGATASADGASGLVPKPLAGDQDKVLKGDGTWGTVAAANHTHGNITSDGKLGTASRVVVTDGDKKIAVSSVTATELGYLSGVTSAVQTQIGGKVSKSGGTMTGFLYYKPTGVNLDTPPSSQMEKYFINIVKSDAQTVNTGDYCRFGIFQQADSKDFRIVFGVANPRAGNLPTAESIANGYDDPDASTGACWSSIGIFYDYNKNRAYPMCRNASEYESSDNSNEHLATTKWVRNAAGNFACNAATASSVPWSGVTGKPSTFTPSSHTHGNITNDGKLGTASRVVVTDGSKAIGVSSITTTKLGYLTDVTANIQGQIDGKADSATTLAGYGITDAKIASGTITLGSNTITPLTSASSLDASKLTGTASVNTTGKATTAGTADKVANKLTLKLKSGSTEGTDLYTYDGSGAKMLDIKQGSNITLTAASGSLTIAGTADTKNTAGSTDSSSKLFLIGATSQAASPQTYSHDTAYVGTDGCLYSGGTKVLTAHQDISAKADDSAVVHKTGNETVAGNKTFTDRAILQGGVFGIDKTNAEEDANDLYIPVAGADQVYYTTSNGGTKLDNIPAAINTTIESRTIRRINASDWVIDQTLHSQNGLYYRRGTSTNGGTWTDWKEFAFTNSNISGNAATATKLATPATINGVAFDGSANITVADSTKVSKSGDTITGDLTISNAPPRLIVKNTSITRGAAPSSNISVSEILGRDSAEKSSWALYHRYATNKSHRISLRCHNGLTTDNQYAEIGVGYDSDGNPYTNAPTPSSATDSTTKIATTAWVRTATGDFACNAATATEFSASKSVTLTGDVTGTASSKAGWSIATTVGAITSAQIAAMFENDGIDPDDPPMAYPERAVLCGDGAWRYFEQIAFPS